MNANLTVARAPNPSLSPQSVVANPSDRLCARTASQDLDSYRGETNHKYWLDEY